MLNLLNLRAGSMLQNSMLQDNPLQALYTPVADDFTQVNSFILEQLHSNASLIDEIDEHIFQTGGKRLRPLLVLLTARACGYQEKDHIALAAVIEFLHTATLLHDDVVDVSSMRRGKHTANHLWGNAPSVLVGDFIYSRAFQIMVQIGNIEVMQVLSSATNVISEGEVLQLMNTRNPELSYEQYFDVIYRKTAMLFEASSHAAAVLSGSSLEKTQAFLTYGKHLGLAFQLIDDALDYNGDPEIMGKNLGDDLAEGKATLPLIYLIQQGTPVQADLIKRAITTGDQSLLNDVTQAVCESGAIDYTLDAAKQQASLALDALAYQPDSIYRKTLCDLAHFSVSRDK